MIAVSDSFKKAIKSDNREIYGYIDVEFDSKDYNLNVEELPESSNLSYLNGYDLIDNVKIIKKYATLENNYFLLDGSFIIANENTLYDSNGFISDDVFSNMTSHSFTITNNSTDLETNGITLYFDDNLIFDFDVTITDNNDNDYTYTVRNNQDYIKQIIFDEPKRIKNLTLDIINVEYVNHRLHIAEISLNIGKIYKGEELVNFEVNEEIDLSLTSVPINTCNIKLNNYPDDNGYFQFDPINPIGITPYLTDKTIIKPYIGVLTDEVGIEYVSLGIFHLTNWSSDSDSNATLEGSDSIYLLKNETIKVNNVSSGIPFQKELYDYNFSIPNINFYRAKTSSVFDILKNYIVYSVPSDGKSRIVFHTNRNDVIERKVFIPSSDYVLNRNSLQSDPLYTIVNPVSKIKINSYEQSTATYAYGPGESHLKYAKELLNATHVLASTEEYIWFPLSHSLAIYNSDYYRFSYTIVRGSATARLVTYGDNMIYVKFTGTVDTELTVVFQGTPHPTDEKNVEFIYTGDNDKGDTIELSYSDYTNNSSTRNGYIKDYFFNNNNYKYDIKLQTFGDPSLEVSDTISVETKYGENGNEYKDMIITKQKFTYDGGLSCELEGKGN